MRLAITSRRLTPEEVNFFNKPEVLPEEINIADGWASVDYEEGES